MGKRPADPGRMLDRALGLVAERGWSGISLAEMAAAAGVPLDTFHRHYPSKASVLRALTHRVDTAMLAGIERAAGEGARDRLFDVIMRRFDALNPHKKAVRAIVRDIGCDPFSLACRSPLAVSPRPENSLCWEGSQRQERWLSPSFPMYSASN